MQQRAGGTRCRPAFRPLPPRRACRNRPFRPQYGICVGADCWIPRSWRRSLTRLDGCCGRGIARSRPLEAYTAESLVRSHKMNHLLKAMGFWVWGLIAIGLSVSVVSSYRMLSVYKSHDFTSQSSEIGSTVELPSPPEPLGEV